ncbi:MAG: diacylglycerol kinase [Gemmatimonadetes bacterium]|nr:diacylglycerol kinase [Gemmatimonadota bacterium]
MPELVMIACAAKNDVIGNGPDIPWSIREEFRHFAELTKGSPCIMGDVTYESLPPRSKPLPGRENIVLSLDPGYEPGGVTLFRDFDEAMAYVRGLESGRAFICGGATIYRLGMAMADTLELTRLSRDYDGDSTFPPVDPEVWRLDRTETASGVDRTSGDEVVFEYQTWRRKSL